MKGRLALSRLLRRVGALLRLGVVMLAVSTVPVVADGQVPAPDIRDLSKQLEALGGEASQGSRDSPSAIRKALEESGLTPPRSGASYMIADTSAGTYFSGMITVRAVEALQQRVLSAKSNTLIVDSPGGYDDAAIDLGRFLRDRRTRVVVRNRCVSACANFIFLSAFEKVVEPNSIVAFHTSALWWDRMAREGRLREDRAAFEARAQTAQKGAQLLRDGSGDRDLNEVLLCMMEHLEPRLDSVKPAQLTDEEGRTVSSFTVETRYSYLILTPTSARLLGIPGIVEFWGGSSNFDEVRLATERAVGRGLHRYGGVGSRLFPCPKNAGRLPTPSTRS